LRRLDYQYRFGQGEATVSVTILARGMTVQYIPRQQRPIILLRFGLANFEFIGTHAEQNRIVLPLKLDGHRVKIVPLPEYRNILEGIKAEKGIDVTCEAHWPVEGDAWQNVPKVADDLCRLLTITRGTIITWLYYDLVAEDGRVAETYHRDSPTAPFSPTPLIDPRVPTDTKQFVESTFKRYMALKDAYKLRKVAHAFANCRSAGFIEMRALLAVVLVDFLRGRWAEQHNLNLVMDEAIFNAKVDQLQRRVRELLGEVFHMDDAALDMMASHVRGFNWRPLRRSLRELRDGLELCITGDEIHHYVESRHSLAHRATFAAGEGPEAIKEYYRILSFLDRIILGILGYRGAYVDCTTWRRVEPA
jgi:hypothetical protein